MKGHALTIIESERRWADFQGGEPIELPNGEMWWFFCPEARTRGGKPGWTFGPDVPGDVDAILSHRLGRILKKLSNAQDEVDRSSVILEAAWFLLARNYKIAPSEFEGILAGAAEWPEERQRELGEQLLSMVGLACVRSTALAEVA